MTVTVCYRLLYYRVTDLVTVQEIDNNLVETERRLGRTTSTICTLGGLARWVGFLGTWLLGCPVRRPYPNPQVTLFIRDRLKALKAVQVFDHSPRATPCRKLERGYIDGDDSPNGSPIADRSPCGVVSATEPRRAPPPHCTAHIGHMRLEMCNVKGPNSVIRSLTLTA